MASWLWLDGSLLVAGWILGVAGWLFGCGSMDSWSWLGGFLVVAGWIFGCGRVDGFVFFLAVDRLLFVVFCSLLLLCGGG